MRRRTRPLTRGQRRYVRVEVVMTALLFAVAFAIRDTSGVGHVIALACAGYGIGFLIHLLAVFGGWIPRKRNSSL